MKYSEYQHLLFEQKGDGILLITINRPEVLNATNAPPASGVEPRVARTSPMTTKPTSSS